jgi:hypothetical protein
MDYCRKHHIDDAQLSARFEADNQLAAKLYRLAQATKITRGGIRRSAGCRLTNRTGFRTRVFAMEGLL